MKKWRSYQSNVVDDTYDAIVIGSGIGGLCTAALLGLFALSTAQQGMQAVYASDLNALQPVDLCTDPGSRKSLCGTCKQKPVSRASVDTH